MKKIINIVFCPQDIDDTQEAINEAKYLIDNGESVTLECDVNLIHVDCLTLLAGWGFKFSSHIKKFVK